LLRWRLLSAGIILAVLFLLLWLDARQAVFGVAGVWLLPVFVALTIMATEEMLALLRNKGHRPVAWPAYVGSAAIALAACMPLFYALADKPFSDDLLGRIGWPFVVFGLGIVVAFAAEMQRFQRPGNSVVNVALSVLTMGYTGVLISFLAALRLIDMGPLGLAAMVSIILIVKLTDTGAYFTGRTLSRFIKTHKMTPILSPGKTWEGAAGGLVSAILGSCLFFAVILPWMVGRNQFAIPPVWTWVVYGIVLAITGTLGDLSESLIKRDMERKDSSTWLPGLGGVLDVLDSILMSAPAAYLCWASGMFGPI
jgi:phosphatidate cytidylyltransferase